MAATDLQIKISADVAELKAALSQAQADIRAMGNTAQAAGAQGAAGFDRAGKGASGFAEQVKSSAAGMFIASAAMAALGSAVDVVQQRFKGFLDTGDRLSELSEKLGETVEWVSGMAYAADQSDTSLDAFANSAKKLMLNLDGADEEGKKATATFKRLGIDTKDAQGNTLSLATLLPQIADKVAALESPIQKTAIATALFGKEGQALVPLLNKGSAGIAELTAQAQKMGLVMSTEAAQAADKLKDKLSTLNQISAAGFNNAFAAAAPQIEALIDLVTQLKTEGGNGNLLGGIIGSGADAIRETVEGLRTIGAAFAPIIDLVQGMVAFLGDAEKKQGDVVAKTNELRKFLEATALEVAGIVDLLQKGVGAVQYLGSAILTALVAPLSMALGVAGSIVGVFDRGLGDKMQGIANQANAYTASLRASAVATIKNADSVDTVRKKMVALRSEEAKRQGVRDTAAAKPAQKPTGKLASAKDGDDSGGKEAADKAKQLADALYSLKKAELEALQKLEDDALKTAAAAYEQAYKDGLLSIKDYYDTAYTIEKTQLDNILALKEAELAAAKDKQAKLAALGDKAKPDAIKAQAEVVKLTADVELAKGAEAKLAAKVDRARADAQKELDSAKLKIDIELAGLQNKDLTRSQIEQSVREGYQSALNKVREDANATQALELLIKTKVDAAELEQVFKRAKTKLDIEIELTGLQGLQLSRQQIEQSLRNQYRELLKQLENDPALTAQLNSIITIKADTQQFEQQLKDLELKNRADTQPLDAQRAQVEQQQGRGEISQPRAQAKLEVINAQQVQQLQTYLQGLETMRVSMGEIAGDAEKMGKALELDAKINATKSSIEGLKPVVMDIGVELENSFANNGAAALESFMNGTKSAKQAFADFAKSVIADIIKMIAKMLIMKAIKMAMGGFADGGAVGGGAQAFATGGSVHGAGGPRDDLIPAWLSNGEHVMDARTVQAFGGHGVFNALRAVGNGRAGASLASALPSQLLASLGNLVNLPSHAPTGGVARLANGGAAVPNLAREGAGQRPVVLTNHFTVQGSVDARSQQQIANATFNAAMRAKTRLS